MKIDEDLEVEKKYLSKGREVVFSYIPYEQLNRLWIMGDFTDWEPREMIKNKDLFTYKIVLLNGYKYYYCYNSSDNFYVDFNHEYELNPKNNQSNNYLVLSDNDPIDDNSNDKMIIDETSSNLKESTQFEYREKGIKIIIN